MIPSNKNYGGTDPQIAKGLIDDGEDIKAGSIREAEEELGFRQNNVNGEIELLDVYSFETTELHIYTAEIKNIDHFDRPHFETGWSGWLEIDDAIDRCTYWQNHILQDVKKNYGNEKGRN